MGNFMEHNPSDAAIAAYHSLTRCMVEGDKISTEYEMYGHSRPSHLVVQSALETLCTLLFRGGKGL